MKILVTETAGFIGFHLAKKLLDRGDEVVDLDNISNYYDVNLKYGRLNKPQASKTSDSTDHLYSISTTGLRFFTVYAPAEKNFMEMQTGNVESAYADTSTLMKDFDHKPYTPLAKGVSEFVQWYRAFYGCN